MASSSRSRIGFYSWHMRQGLALADYERLVEYLLTEEAEQLLVRVGEGLAVKVEGFRRASGVTAGLFVLVELSADVTLYSHARHRTDVVSPPSGTSVAHVSRLVFSEAHRYRVVGLESKRNGLTIDKLETYLEHVAVQLLGGEWQADMSRILSSSLVEEIERLDRIRLARVTFHRPNLDWDEEEERAHELARESGAARVTTEVVAARSESLRKNSGVIGALLRRAGRAMSNVASFEVEGDAGAEKGLKITDKAHQLVETVVLPHGATVDEVDAAVLRAFGARARELEQSTALGEGDLDVRG